MSSAATTSPESLAKHCNSCNAHQCGFKVEVYAQTSNNLDGMIFCFYDQQFSPSSLSKVSLLHTGKLFEQSIHAFCNIQLLIRNGIIRKKEQPGKPDEAFTAQ